jgi:hypothetical protein
MKIFFLPLLFLGCVPASEESMSNNSTKPQPDTVKTVAIVQQIQIKSLEKFESDTLAYLRENFVANKVHFIGQPFKILLAKLDLPVVRYIPIRENYPNLDRIIGVYLKFETDATWLNKINSKKIPNVLSITFNHPLKSEDISKISKKDDRFWGKEAFDFYGAVIIKDVNLLKNNTK